MIHNAQPEKLAISGNKIIEVLYLLNLFHKVKGSTRPEVFVNFHKKQIICSKLLKTHQNIIFSSTFNSSRIGLHRSKFYCKKVKKGF